MHRLCMCVSVCACVSVHIEKSQRYGKSINFLMFAFLSLCQPEFYQTSLAATVNLHAPRFMYSYGSWLFSAYR